VGHELGEYFLPYHSLKGDDIEELLPPYLKPDDGERYFTYGKA